MQYLERFLNFLDSLLGSALYFPLVLLGMAFSSPSISGSRKSVISNTHGGSCWANVPTMMPPGRQPTFRRYLQRYRAPWEPVILAGSGWPFF